MKNICDIIIPIYNAYEAVVDCINSVIKNSDLKNDRLILINDCSTDTRISEHINGVRQQNSELNIVVIENEINKGFVGTVNVGMRYSNTDVLLLNSDTIVGKNWLDKMKRCAYSQPKVGTVTAMSNNATLASVPKGLMRNEIPEDITIDEYNDMLTECAYRDYPELPTAHGFCMYIRREVLDKLGLFDEESFGRGYGEENDFSYRCMDFGFKNLLCDDVIVYHLESQSFSDERSKVIEEHSKILQNKYREYYNAVGYWCHTFPILHICRNIYYNLNLRKKKNVLLLIHEWDNVLGGTTIHVKDIISSISSEFNFHVLFPSNGNYVIESYFGEEKERITLPFTINNMSKYNRFNSAYQDMLDSVVQAFAIDAVHVHHMAGHYFDIGEIIKKHNLNSAITIHDLYPLCPVVGMLYCNEKYCDDMQEKDCEKCLVSTQRASNNIISEWQNDWYEFLKKFNIVIAPSNDTKKRINAVYKDIDITVIEHGVNMCKIEGTQEKDNKLRVAFIGVLCRHKGADMIRELISTCKDSDIEFHAFGKAEEGFDDLQKGGRNYIFHGAYDRDKLGELLIKNKINLICFLQICPETYSYTVNEAISAKIPVLSVDLGAGADRIKAYGLGWIVSKYATSKEIINKLTYIKNNVNEYSQVQKSVASYNFKTVEQMGNDYKLIYNNCKTNRVVDYEQLRYILKEECRFAPNTVVNVGAARMLDDILRSAKWRLISKIRVPQFFSRPLKAVLRALKRIIKR